MHSKKSIVFLGYWCTRVVGQRELSLFKLFEYERSLVFFNNFRNFVGGLGLLESTYSSISIALRSLSILARRDKMLYRCLSSNKFVLSMMFYFS